MELKNILSGLEGLKVKGDLTIDITNVESDSRNIKKGGLFVAIKGFDVDGHEYIKQAIKNGAVAVIASPEIDKKLLKEIIDKVTIIIAPDTRLALAICACNFNDNPVITVEYEFVFDDSTINYHFVNYRYDRETKTIQPI